MTSLLQLTGGLIIAFIYSWKLALVATFVTIPIGLACAYYRFKYEIQFEKMSAAVCPQSPSALEEPSHTLGCCDSPKKKYP